MKRTAIIIGSAAALVLLGIWFLTARQSAVVSDIAFINSSITMKIESPAFEQNGEIPAEYTCDGKDINPPLVVNGVPAQAKSLVLLVEDPDAVSGTWFHWLVWNIDPSTANFASGAVPRGGVEGTTSAGRTGWHGPCPPSGSHRYFFKIYALDVTLDLPTSTQTAELERAMHGHILDKAGLVGLYKRK